MRKIISTAASVAPVTASLTGVSLLQAGPARAVDSYSYSCWTGTPIPQCLTKKSDPRNCKGLDKIANNSGYIVVIDNRRIKSWADYKKIIMGSYATAQKWCSSNALTCAVRTSTGIAALQGVLGSVNA